MAGGGAPTRRRCCARSEQRREKNHSRPLATLRAQCVALAGRASLAGLKQKPELPLDGLGSLPFERKGEIDTPQFDLPRPPP